MLFLTFYELALCDNLHFTKIYSLNDTYKFKYSEIKKGGRASEFEESLEWLERVELVLRCFNLKAIEKPLESNIDGPLSKCFCLISDY